MKVRKILLRELLLKVGNRIVRRSIINNKHFNLHSGSSDSGKDGVEALFDVILYVVVNNDYGKLHGNLIIKCVNNGSCALKSIYCLLGQQKMAPISVMMKLYIADSLNVPP